MLFSIYPIEYSRIQECPALNGPAYTVLTLAKGISRLFFLRNQGQQYRIEDITFRFYSRDNANYYT